MNEKREKRYNTIINEKKSHHSGPSGERKKERLGGTVTAKSKKKIWVGREETIRVVLMQVRTRGWLASTFKRKVSIHRGTQRIIPLLGNF